MGSDLRLSTESGTACFRAGSSDVEAKRVPLECGTPKYPAYTSFAGVRGAWLPWELFAREQHSPTDEQQVLLPTWLSKTHHPNSSASGIVNRSES